MSSDNDSDDLFPSPGGDAFDSVEGSDDSDSESETLTQIKGSKCLGESKKKRKAKTVQNTAKGPKKKTTKKRLSVTKEVRPASARSRSSAYIQLMNFCLLQRPS